MITSAVWLSWWYKLNLSKGRINSSSKLFLFHYFSVIKVAFYFQFNTNMITSSPSSLNSLLHISLVLYKSHIVWCHCWCIIEQHFVCCSGDWRYRFIRKVRPCRLYFWKAFHDSLQVFWWNLCRMFILTHQCMPTQGKDLYPAHIHLHWSVWRKFPSMVVYLPKNSTRTWMSTRIPRRYENYVGSDYESKF